MRRREEEEEEEEEEEDEQQQQHRVVIHLLDTGHPQRNPMEAIYRIVSYRIGYDDDDDDK